MGDIIVYNMIKFNEEEEELYGTVVGCEVDKFTIMSAVYSFGLVSVLSSVLFILFVILLSSLILSCISPLEHIIFKIISSGRVGGSKRSSIHRSRGTSMRRGGSARGLQLELMMVFRARDILGMVSNKCPGFCKCLIFSKS